MSRDAYLNDISLAVPDRDIHRKIIDFAPSLLAARSTTAIPRYRPIRRAGCSTQTIFMRLTPSPIRRHACDFTRRMPSRSLAARWTD